MTMLDMRLIERSFVHQHDMTDCGAACLLSLVRYYGGDSSMLHLREISGTSNTGTTLLGLYQAAERMGFDAKGAEANGIPDLIEHGNPCILAVIMDKVLQHFVICYGYESGKFIISDPARGIVEMSDVELDAIWTRKCLLLEPNTSFERKGSIKGRKRDWLRNLIRDDFGILGASVAIGLVISVLGMVMSVFSQKLVDEVLPSHNMTKLIVGIVLVLILMLANVAVSTLRGKLLITQSRDFNNRIIRFFFGKLLNLPKSFFDTRKTGDMVARLNDTRRIQAVISTLSGEVIINALVLIVSFAFLFIYSWKVALMALFCVPFYYWIISRNNDLVAARQRDVMSSYAMSESGFINTIEGMSDIKSFLRQTSFQRTNELLYSTFQNRVYSLGQTKLSIGFWAGIVGVVIQIGIVAICSIFVFDDALTTGELMAVIGISGVLFPAVTNLALVMIPINEARVAFDRMYELVDAEEEIKEKETENDSLLEARCLEITNLAFRFVGRRRIFENVTLKFNKGTISCIVGESGCGKSTLCQVMERFYTPEEGEIFLDGIPAAEINLGLWRRLISIVPQDIFLYNGTVLENICFGCVPKDSNDVMEFCHRYGFDKFVAELPNGLATLVGEEGINLSGGQKQLIAFARALYKPSRILILDEMTAAMDRRTEKYICGVLDSLRKDHIIIFVTHRLETARLLGDNIVVMENGHITAQGTHSGVMRAENFYSEYWKSITL